MLDVTSLFRRSRASEIAPSFLEDFLATAGADDFPCVFAPAASRRDELLFGLADAGKDDNAVVRLMDLAVEAIWDDPDQVVILWLAGVPSTSVEDDLTAFQGMLRKLLAASARDWPADAPTDPADLRWNFWYKGVDFFINVSTRHHRLRRSRNLGSCFTLVVQSRASFDRLPKQAATARASIRRRLARYDAVDVSPLLGTHGDRPELPQYFLGDSNTCPYHPITEEDIVTAPRPGQHA